MAAMVTYLGEEYELYGTAGDGSLARLGTRVKLFSSTSSPAKDGTGFTEVADGNGYTIGGKTISRANWSLAGPPTKVVLGNQAWTALGGSIANIAGAYLTNTAGDVLAWWALDTPITILEGESVTTSAIGIELN